MSEPVAGSAESRPRILVADDEADLRLILQMKLDRAGMEVTVVDNGLEARDLAHRLEPDLAVFDVSMPGMSGLEVVRDLRAAGMRLPIVVLSARATDAEVQAGRDAGASAYVTKPFSPNELVLMITELLEQER